MSRHYKKLSTATEKSGPANPERRQLLRQGFASVFALSTGSLLNACGGGGGSGPTESATVSNIANLGPLSATPDANGVRLPAGFTSRILARTDQFVMTDSPVSASNYVWHDLPDGAACFTTPGGGWIYASNSEANNGLGGVGAIEFDSNGNVINAFQLLSGTSKNCAGGPTPWNTWLSCEEFPGGMVWECFPLDRSAANAVRHDAMGVFNHEAAVVDPVTGIVYLTEDSVDSCIYRFIPDTSGDLSGGTLQAAIVDSLDPDGFALEGMMSWVEVPDPSAATLTVRAQAQQLGAAKFRRGEGAWFQDGVFYFATTGDNVIWACEPDGDTAALTQIYNRTDLFPDDLSLNGIDNLTASAGGDILVAEDTDDTQIQAITPGGQLVPLLQLTGHQIGFFPGELTGPAFDPSGTRLYFSSQRGTEADRDLAGKLIGVTFEITGPFVVAS